MKPQFAAHTPADGSDRWHALKEHLSDVAKLTRTFANKFGAGEIGHYAGLWHDLGKYKPEFQWYLEQCHEAAEAELEYIARVPHAIYGAKLASELLKPVAPIIYGHHAGLPKIQHMNDRLKELDAVAYQVVLEQSQHESLDLKPSADFKSLMLQLCNDEHSYELLTRLLFSCLVDADYLDTEDHFEPDTAKQRGTHITIAP